MVMLALVAALGVILLNSNGLSKMFVKPGQPSQNARVTPASNADISTQTQTQPWAQPISEAAAATGSLAPVIAGTVGNLTSAWNQLSGSGDDNA